MVHVISKRKGKACFVLFFFTNSNTHSISNETQENAKLLPDKKIKMSEVRVQDKGNITHSYVCMGSSLFMKTSDSLEVK